MIKLYQFPAYWGLPNASPFCMKLETYLRMARLPYEVVKVMDPRKAPKGKLPYINDNGKIIADSGLIVDYLKQAYGNTLDGKLNELQKAQLLAWQRLIEEHLYWAILYSRWIDDNNWPVVKQVFFGKAPLVIREMLSVVIRKNMQRQLLGHGMGRHTQSEIYQLGIADLKALNVQLGSNAFLFGNEPTSLDASGYAFIANILYPPIESPMADYVKSQQNFISYCERMKGKFY